MWLTCEDPPKSCLTCVSSKGSQYFQRVPWLTWSTMSYLPLFDLSAGIGLKQKNNNRLQIKAIRCISASYYCLHWKSRFLRSVTKPLLFTSELWTLDLCGVFFLLPCILITPKEGCGWVWLLVQDQGSQWGVFVWMLLTQQTLLCEQWHKFSLHYQSVQK